jgi:hypothetical protein
MPELMLTRAFELVDLNLTERGRGVSLYKQSILFHSQCRILENAVITWHEENTLIVSCNQIYASDLFVCYVGSSFTVIYYDIIISCIYNLDF